MANIRDFLYRLRPAGAPGPAGPAGVPADRRADAEQELAEIFAALAATEAECADIRSRAEWEADRSVERAQRMAGAVVARTRVTATAQRADAAATAAQSMHGRIEEILAQAEEEADRVRQMSERRTPILLPRIVDRARQEIGDVARDGGA